MNRKEQGQDIAALGIKVTPAASDDAIRQLAERASPEDIARLNEIAMSRARLAIAGFRRAMRQTGGVGRCE